jgi:TPR repeat protein
MQLAARGNMRGAERWFRHAMEMGNIQAIRGLGDVKLSGGDLQAAAEYYQQAIGRGDIIATYQLSTVYIRQDAPGKAEQLLRGMLDTRFDFRDRPEKEEEALGRAARQLGFLLEDQGKTKEAEDMYETATRYGIADASHDLARLREERDE